MNFVNFIKELFNMSNVPGTFPIQTVSTDGSGDATVTLITTPASADGTTPAVTETITISAAQLKGFVPTAQDVINVLEDGNYTFTTPELTAEAPVTFPTLATATAAIGSAVVSINTASGVPIAVVNGAVDLTQTVTVPASDFEGAFTLVTAA